MVIESFDRENAVLRNDLARLLEVCFPDAYGDSAADEVFHLLEAERIALAAFVDGKLAGFIGAIPNYGSTGWELHPLAVFPEYQRQGVGKALVAALEQAVKSRGGITLYLGTDDESGSTSLAHADLYDRLWERIANIQNINNHPFQFYQKQGYVIVGVLPDVNGFGRPDIYMAKRLVQYPT